MWMCIMSSQSLVKHRLRSAPLSTLFSFLPSDRDTSVHYENQYYPDFLFYWLALWACWLYAEQVQLLFVQCLAQCLCIFYQYLTDDATHIQATVASISLHISSSKTPDQDGAPPALLLPGRLPGPGRRPPRLLPHRSLLQVIIRAVT